MANICVVTGTRAEFGLLLPVIKKIMADEALTLKLAVTGAHLSSRHGATRREIKLAQVQVDAEIPIIGKDSGQLGVAKAMAAAVSGFAAYFQNNRPDILVLLGDRYESFAAAAAAAVFNIPIAHLHGGEITESAVDEYFRHSITKMSYLHFTCCEAYRRRVIQLGESPDRVFNVGALGVENIKRLELPTKDELKAQIGFNLTKPYFLITCHPVTLDNRPPDIEAEQLLKALDKIKAVNAIFTKANADAGGDAINQIIDGYVKTHPKSSIAYHNLGIVRYLAAMKYCEAVVGNTSSGIIEAPSMHVPTVNIGDRQKGRVRADSVLDCAPQADMIYTALIQARTPTAKALAKQAVNPYEGIETADRIVHTIKEYVTKKKINIKKAFYDLPDKQTE